jgi:catechol 2,3-dioxygenase-like lactoylglutathione lyase family enzyme
MLQESENPLGHASLGYIFANVRDVDRLIPFYRDTLGFDVVFHQPGVCLFINLPAVRYPQLAFYQAPPEQCNNTGWFVALNVPDLARTVALLRARGLTVGDIERVPNGRAVSITAPEGLRIEFHQPDESPCVSAA